MKKSGIITRYRPCQWSGIVGQSKRVAELQKLVLAGEVYHNNYLISGPYGSGKTTVARILAKTILCENRVESSVEPCGVCPACVEVEAGGIMRGFVELDAGSSGGIDRIREVLDQAHQHPGNTSGWKVFIIDECHLLTGAAASALLKVLEEKISVVFIMATTEPQKMIDTVKSRLKHLILDSPPWESVYDLLGRVSDDEGLLWENLSVKKETLSALAQKSVPHIRLALQGIGDIKSRFVNQLGTVVSKDALNFAKGEERTWFDLFKMIHQETLDPGLYEAKLDELEKSSDVSLDSQIIGFMKLASGKATGKYPTTEGLTVGECRGVFWILWEALKSQTYFKAFFREVVVFALVECAQAKKEGYLGGLMKFAGDMMESQKKNEALLEALAAIAGKEKVVRQKLESAQDKKATTTGFNQATYE